MLSLGASSAAWERHCTPRSWGGFSAPAPVRTSTSFRLSCVVPPSATQHAVLLGRNSWTHFKTRSYRSFPPRPPDNRFFGELTLSHHAATGLSAYAIDPIASGGGFHLR